MSTSSWTRAVLFLALGVVGGWTAHRLLVGEAVAEIEAAAIAPVELSAGVTTAVVTSGPLDVMLPALGVVRAATAVDWDLSTAVSSRVAEVDVAVGQQVTAGALLLRFDRKPLEAMIGADRAGLETAEQELAAYDAADRQARRQELAIGLARTKTAAELAAAQLERLRGLRADDLIAERTLIEAQRDSELRQLEQQQAQRALEAFDQTGAALQRQRLQAAVATTHAALTAHELAMADVELRAPADGTVSELLVRAGDVPAAGAPLGRLLLGQGRRLEFELTAGQLARVPPQAAVTVHVGGAVLRGQIEAVAAAVDADTGMARVFVALPDADLLVGLAVRVEIVLQHLELAILVPAAAVVRAGDRLVVVKVGSDGLAHVVPVRVLGQQDGRVAVDGEVTAGDAVVVAGAYNLPDGARVVRRSGSSGEGR